MREAIPKFRLGQAVVQGFCNESTLNIGHIQWILDLIFRFLRRIGSQIIRIKPRMGQHV